MLKANWGRFYFNPGITSPTRSTPTPPTSTPTHVWNDLNGDRVFQDGEAGRAGRSAFGGTAGASIDPNIAQLVHR